MICVCVWDLLGLQLVVPKFHGAKLEDIPDDYLQEVLVLAKRIAKALGSENYNIVQNNGALAFQVSVEGFFLHSPQHRTSNTLLSPPPMVNLPLFKVVFHFHLHVIPKTTEDNGLLAQKPNFVKMTKKELGALADDLKTRL